ADECGVEAGGVAAGKVAFEGLHVFAGLGRLVMIGNDERGGLELMNERVSFGEMPVGIGLVPHAVEPDAADGAVVGEEFGELAVHVGVDVRVEVAVIGAAVVPGGATAREIVRVMPIE